MVLEYMVLNLKTLEVAGLHPYDTEGLIAGVGYLILKIFRDDFPRPGEKGLDGLKRPYLADYDIIRERGVFLIKTLFALLDGDINLILGF